MSHHLADMIEQVENEENEERKEKFQRQTVDLILKIWEHRSSLNGNAYPLARFKGVIDSVSILSPEANVWEKNRLGKYQSLAADSYSMVVHLYRTSHFIEFASLNAVRSSQVPPGVFSNDEQETYDFLTTWAEEEVNFRSSESSSSDKTEFEKSTDGACDLIDKLCGKLTELKSKISEKNK